MLDRNHLTIIKAVAETGTVTQAASQLCLTQSALSHAIKKVELHYQVQVWQKEGRKLRLTQAGNQLLNLANRLLPQFEYAEQQLEQIAHGKKGILRIGMECHPCYQWLLKTVKPFLAQCEGVDVDVRQKFQFGGLSALLGYEIDLLITPDPLFHHNVRYTPVFDYEHALVVSGQSPLAELQQLNPEDLSEQTLITYPVEASRLDIFSHFLTPAGASVKQHKIIENTEIMLQMVAANRGVAALPRWLIEEYQQHMDIKPISLISPTAKNGIQKSIHLGIRENETPPEYLNRFMELSKRVKVT
ncbi:MULTISPECIES: LysR family transcriptional regulator [Alteromonadaceae]|uniref:LysR family transcriptional regulator n=1 Tax=Alteromonadaceae TaxID=72275 RepID=UPI001C090866|nr:MULTISPECIES: LysR family transcriptional regulator [Aliiglaciecola]MBU2880096.1 LysR family transcriptional regulator [Aliiglaciecola lipolytica]MDO6710906.1 LysR family transcriptional regulator [Aliiglaciecola sp. 2_MG-2023]MDO6752387.1 LysR family transcriptional regulator [Aliiglaciecola sp. 1_MG-2023]